MKQLIHTTAEDQFLEDPEKAIKVTQWIADSLEDEPTEYIDKFVKIFPDELVVSQYLNREATYDRLFIHVQAVRSRLPMKVYLNVHGVTDSYIVRRLKFWADAEDGEISLKALNALIKLRYQNERALRVNLKQTNIYQAKEDEHEKEDLVERIYKKLEERAKNSRPKTIRKDRPPARKRSDPI